jgi:secondary thiamine-phosphate synthase enzyme
MPLTLTVHTESATEVVDITARVETLIAGATSGSCHLYLRHTTAGLMVMTWETGVPEDIMGILQSLTPPRAYRHDKPAHVAAHFLSALVGPGVHVPVRDGRLGLGEFQRVVLLEFEGPRRREIELCLLAEAEALAPSRRRD